MTEKFTKLDMFQELSVILARIEDKLDKVTDLENRVKVLEAELQTRLNQKYSTTSSVWMNPQDIELFNKFNITGDMTLDVVGIEGCKSEGERKK